jgi:hypothetical protein
VIEVSLEARPHNLAVAASLVQTNTITASILRTHSQCQRGVHQHSENRCITAAELVSSSLGLQLWREAAPLGRAMQRLMAFALVEPIGIEPMT